MSGRNTIISLVMNLMIAAATVGIVISYFCGNDGEYHIPPYFRFFLFTTDSNILCMSSALVLSVFEIRYLKTGKEIPKAVMIFKHTGVAAAALTFAVVVLFLGPTMGYVSMLFVGTSVYMHLLGPLLGIISFCFIENVCRLEKKYLLFTVLPALIYGIVYLVMVIFIGENNGGWYDFYGFNIGGFWYLSSAALILLSLGISAVLRLIHNKFVHGA